MKYRFRVRSPNFANFEWPNLFMGKELGGLTILIGGLTILIGGLTISHSVTKMILVKLLVTIN